MKETNKKTVIMWLEIFALFIYGLLTIITCSAVWNSRPGAFISIVALALFGVNGYIIVRKAMKLSKDNDKKEE